MLLLRRLALILAAAFLALLASNQPVQAQMSGEQLLREQSCLQGEDADCANFGRWLSNSRSDPEKGMSLLARGCEGGNAFACFSLGEGFQFRWFDGTADPVSARIYYRYGCEFGLAESCGYLGELTQSEGDHGTARTYLLKACQMGYGMGCLLGASNFEKALGGDADLGRAAAMFTAACEQFKMSPCKGLEEMRQKKTLPANFAIMTITPSKPALGRTRDTYRATMAALAKAFEPGPGQESPERVRERELCYMDHDAACAALGSMLTLGEGGPKHPRGAQVVLERACDGGFAMACYFQGLNWQDKFYPGSATHELRALKYYNRACNLNLAGGCANEGFLTERLINDVPAARQLGLKACQMGDPAGCHNAGRISLMYLVDGASAPDLGLAASLFTIACNASIAQSCSALQGMRATGRLPAQLPRFAVRPSTPNAGRVLPRSMIDARDARKVREAQASIAQAQQTMSNSASGGYYGSSNPAANWVTVRTYDTRGNYTGSTRESAVWADIMSKVGSTR